MAGTANKGNTMAATADHATSTGFCIAFGIKPDTYDQKHMLNQRYHLTKAGNRLNNLPTINNSHMPTAGMDANAPICTPRHGLAA